MIRHSKTKSLNLQKSTSVYNNPKDPKVSNISGNIIHVTVNNFLGPSKGEENIVQEKKKELKQSSDEVYESIL